MTLWSLEIYDRIMIRLKTIEYKINVICYLSFLFLGLVIKRSYLAYLFVLITSKFFCYKIPCYLSNTAVLLGF